MSFASFHSLPHKGPLTSQTFFVLGANVNILDKYRGVSFIFSSRVWQTGPWASLLILSVKFYWNSGAHLPVDHPHLLCTAVVACWFTSVVSDSLWPQDCSPPGCSVHGILQARILEWVAVPSSRGSSRPKGEPASLVSPALAGGFFTTSATWEATRSVANPWTLWCLNYLPKTSSNPCSKARDNCNGVITYLLFYHWYYLVHKVFFWF